MSQNIYPKTCGYGCGLQIYWNTAENTFFEVVAQKKHVCPNNANRENLVLILLLVLIPVIIVKNPGM